jgi:hypothetical protein
MRAYVHRLAAAEIGRVAQIEATASAVREAMAFLVGLLAESRSSGHVPWRGEGCAILGGRLCG